MRRLSLDQNWPYISSDLTSQTLYYTYGASDGGALSLDMSGLSADTAYDIYDLSGTLTPVAMPNWLPTTAQCPTGTVITTGTGSQTWIRTSAINNGNHSQAASACAWNYPSNSGANNFIGEDAGSGNSYAITSCKVYAPTDDYLRGDAPSSLAVAIALSNDGSTWTTVYSGNLNASGATGQVYTINFANTTAYRFRRICLNGNGSNAVKVGNIDWFYSNPAAARGISYDGADWVNGNDDVYLGSLLTDTTAGQATQYVSYGSNRRIPVWNAKHRVPVVAKSGLLGTSYSPAGQSTGVFGPVAGSALVQVKAVIGLPIEPTRAMYRQAFFQNGTSAVTAYWNAIGIDSTTVASGFGPSANFDNTGNQAGESQCCDLILQPTWGAYAFNALEGARNNVTCFKNELNMLMTVSFDA